MSAPSGTAWRSVSVRAEIPGRSLAATRAAIEHSAPHLGRLSAERVQQELVKTLEETVRLGVGRVDETGGLGVGRLDHLGGRLRQRVYQLEDGTRRAALPC